MINNNPLKLSALDQSPIRDKGTFSDALTETIELAQICDKAGYHRYWLAEHHASDSYAGSTPEILIGQIANTTKKIRVGSGGVMLSHYSPLKVAETFNTLETLFPGRIDLGIGRAPGSDQVTAMALGYGSEIGIEYFPTRIADMLSFIGGTKPSTELFKNIKISPKPETIPELWLLGSSGQSAQYAAQFGLSFTFAHFIAPNGGQSVIQNYIKHFQHSPFNKKSRSSLCVFITCAETEHEARQLARSRDLVLLKRSKGERGPYPSDDEIESYPYTEQDLKLIEYNRPQSLYGDPDQCVEILSEMANDYQVEELVILTICHDPKDRKASYKLLADAFNTRKS